MSTQQLKRDIVNRLKEVDDDIILDEIYRILKLGVSTKEVFIFNEEQLTLLDARDKEIDYGNFLTDEDADKDFEEWLQK